MPTNKGFTLLELLLVVGIAAALLVGGLWAAIAVQETHRVTEVVRLVNMIRSETNRLRFEMAVADDTDLEALLLAKGRIGHRFIDEGNNLIMTPYSSEAYATSVHARANAVTEIGFAIPPAKAIELYSQFPVNASQDIVRFDVCGLVITLANAGTVGTPDNVANSCGSSKTVPTVENVAIHFALQ